jgi:hypothetical protein
MVIATVVDAQSSDWDSNNGNKINGNNRKTRLTNGEYTYVNYAHCLSSIDRKTRIWQILNNFLM